MKTAIMKLASAIVGLTACLSATAAATNALFLPVDAKPFGSLAANAEYNAREQTNAIRSGECKPADQDPEGHWGKVVNGFQLSIRSATNAFVRGHPATVTVLLRNSTTNALQSLGGYYVATVFLTDGAGHERQATPLGSFSGPMSATIPGMRQLKDTITLSPLSPGTYNIWAKRKVYGSPENLGAWQELRSGTLTIKIVE